MAGPVRGGKAAVERPEPAGQPPVEERSSASPAANGSRPLLVHDLGWSEEDVADSHFRLRPFEADWDAPGMDAYDDL